MSSTETSRSAAGVLAHVDLFWGCWFAGFVDGEGCFWIEGSEARGTYRCGFTIKLRADDRPVLEKIRKHLGVGSLHDVPSVKWNPQVAFQVNRKRDVSLLCDVFETCLLQTKKARDFRIWARAADAWVVHDWDTMAAAKAELTETRQFSPELSVRTNTQPEEKRP